jgi:hypothetical protein
MMRVENCNEPFEGRKNHEFMQIFRNFFLLIRQGEGHLLWSLGMAAGELSAPFVCSLCTQQRM